jgi:DnaJ domain/Protein of unknown function (DUF1232)
MAPMSLYLKIILILLGLAYLISPVDIIPELFLPYVGWIDDGVVLWSILHLIRYGELPWFLFKKNEKRTQTTRKNDGQGPNYNGFHPGKAPFRNTHKEKKNWNSGNTSKVVRSAHEILGVSSNATLEEIHTAYKEKIKQYHPDKVSHLGEEFSHLANEKFLEIQKAYGELKVKF